MKSRFFGWCLVCLGVIILILMTGCSSDNPVGPTDPEVIVDTLIQVQVDTLTVPIIGKATAFAMVQKYIDHEMMSQDITEYMSLASLPYMTDVDWGSVGINTPGVISIGANEFRVGGIVYSHAAEAYYIYGFDARFIGDNVDNLTSWEFTEPLPTSSSMSNDELTKLKKLPSTFPFEK